MPQHYSCRSLPLAAVAVIGATNVDLVVTVDARPAAGETVLGRSFDRRAGGKGANQAVAAARTGVTSMLISVVGSDEDGQAQLARLVSEGVDVACISVDHRRATGIAFITVTPDAENSIVVVPGANALLSAEEVRRSLDGLGSHVVVVAQTEVSASAVDAAAAVCRESGARLVLNTAPVVRLDPDTLAMADPLVANEHEARQLCGGDSVTPAIQLSRRLLEVTGARSVVVTLGSAGATLSRGPEDAVVPAQHAIAVDTTGAGDMLVGTLAASLATGADLVEALRAGVVAAAEAVTFAGARAPLRDARPHELAGQPEPVPAAPET